MNRKEIRQNKKETIKMMERRDDTLRMKESDEEEGELELL